MHHSICLELHALKCIICTIFYALQFLHNILFWVHYILCIVLHAFGFRHYIICIYSTHCILCFMIFSVCLSIFVLSLGLFWSERIIWKWMLIEGQIIWFNLLILIQSKIKQIIGQQIITHDSINKYQNARPRNFLVWEKWNGSRRQSSSLKVIQNFNAKTKYLFLKSTLSFRPLLHRKWIL